MILNVAKIVSIFAISSPAFFFFNTLPTPHDDDAVHAETLLKTTKSWDGQTYAGYAKGQPEITILKIKVAPRAKLHLHQHPFINAGVVTRGKLKVVIPGGKTKIVKAGEALAEIVNTVHYGENITDQEAEIIVFYAGIQGKSVTIKSDENRP